MTSSIIEGATKTPKKQKIRTVVRNANQAEWVNDNPIPDKGELVYALDLNTLKIGDGRTSYVNLPSISGGEPGTTDYNDLTNKPSINNIALQGDLSTTDLGFANVATTGNYNDLSNLPTLGTMAAENASDYTPTSNLATVAITGSYDDLINKPYIPEGVVVDQTYNATSINAQSGTAIAEAIANKVDNSSLANVAFTGSYDDLTNQPTIPTTVAQLSDASDYALVNSLANVATTGEYSDLLNTPVIPAAQVQTDWNATSGMGVLLNKPNLANVAISGDYNDLTNTPAFGTAAFANTTDFATAAEGNLATTAVQPGDLANVATTGSYDDLINKPYIPAGVIVDLTYDPLSTNATAGTAVAEAVANKQDTLINGTNIKSLNGNSLLGSGDLTLDGLPDQTGNSGKYLTTNGTTASWNNLANVAISGSYDDLVNTPVLGSMAYANTSDYTITSNLANVALSGEYSDLLNKPTIPDPQIQSDWNQTNTSAVDYIKNKPTIPVGVVVDQVYNGTSTNAQSGTAVAGAISTKSNVVLRDWSI